MVVWSRDCKEGLWHAEWSSNYWLSWKKRRSVSHPDLPHLSVNNRILVGVAQETKAAAYWVSVTQDLEPRAPAPCWSSLGPCRTSCCRTVLYVSVFLSSLGKGRVTCQLFVMICVLIAPSKRQHDGLCSHLRMCAVCSKMYYLIYGDTLLHSWIAGFLLLYKAKNSLFPL